MAEGIVVDRALVQALNHAAQPQPLRLLVLLVATALAAGPALMLAVLAVQALRRRDSAALAVIVLTGLGAAAALGLNQLAGHLYFRSHPYWALPAVHAIARSAARWRWGTPTPTETWTPVGHNYPPTAGPDRTRPDTQHSR